MNPSAYIGIDVSKKTLDAALYQPAKAGSELLHATFKNSTCGANDIIRWAIRKARCKPQKLRVTMEVTGVYYLAVARACHAAGCQVVVCNPRRSRSYAVAIGHSNKTDKHDAIALASYGTQRGLILWQPPPPEIADLNALLTRLHGLMTEIQREGRRRQAAEICEASTTLFDSLARVRAFQISEYRTLLEAVEALFRRYPRLCAERELLLTIPSVGPLVACHLLCILRRCTFRSARQLAAFAGLAPVHVTSGTSVKAKPRLPRGGHHILRGFLYMSAVGSLRTPQGRALYDRFLAKGLRPRQALIAVMRKMIHIAFGVWKHGQPYRADWEAFRRRVAPGSDASAKHSSARASQCSEEVLVPSCVVCEMVNGIPHLVKRRIRSPGYRTLQRRRRVAKLRALEAAAEKPGKVCVKRPRAASRTRTSGSR